ncbi:mitochondrial protein C2orf69 homolog isoform X2 [Plodia interpunctella]|uniref:mitochondrial protein C2orf69 homolog isoform X2 n=1 Tax=Plodia interpunctella TaxID=58824 RepID=UPI0023674746|nr:mitochondrial protein C2orf69 homolog isoform X2 [Plodia interpunctella]
MLPLRLRLVAGHEGRANDALFQPARRPPVRPPAPAQTLVYFGGDVQDYPEVMQAHRDNRNYVKWNLENTARMLSHNFPHKHILVVRPSRIEYKSFSCYDNFVPSNNAGVPDHTPTHSALRHLERLLQGVSSRLKAMPTSELLEAVTSVSLPEEIDIEDLHNTSIHGVGQGKSNGSTRTDAVATDDSAPEPDVDPLWWREQLALDSSRLTLVGFSKGCVVLNQIVYEFHYTNTLTPGDQHTVRFISRIEEMYWLDGGHAGGKNTWVTSRSLLETLTRLNLNLYVHVSPYQVQDEARPWIGREEKAFVSLLRKLGAKVNRYLHDQPGSTQSLQMHFEVLARFKRVQDHAQPSHSDDDDDM